MNNLLQQIKTARRCSVPLVAISTPDPWATVEAILAATAGEDFHLGSTVACMSVELPGPVRIEWDFVRGYTSRGDAGRTWLFDCGNATAETVNSPYAAFVHAQKLPPGAILFVHLAHRFIHEPAMIQALANLRDPFKTNHRMVILLGQSMTLPPELAGDVVSLDEPLPDRDQLRAIVSETHEGSGVPLDDNARERSVEAIQGLPAFQAEQAVAMCLRRNGVDMDGLWERKRQQIEQTPALKVWRGTDSFDSVGGCETVKGFLSRVMAGAARPNAVVFVDEIEKMLGGTGDTSGVSQDQLGVLLSYMQDHGAAGMIFVGPPGAAKSAIAKAAGSVSGVPTIQLDLGAAKGSLVGQSEQQVREALKVVTAVSNGRSLWIATCNAIANLPPELRRRFTLGTFFFDLPTADERTAIWNIYAAKFPTVPALPRPRDEGWTGAEIRQCYDIAWRIGCTLCEAAEFVVPVSRSAAEAIDKLRTQADGKFLSASYPGVYKRAPTLNPLVGDMSPRPAKPRRAAASLPEDSKSPKGGVA
jgi:hypothetical protein